MAKPVLLGLNGKVKEVVGTEARQVLTWSADAEEWVPGPGANSGGGGQIYYLNEDTAAASPTTNIPTSSNGLVTVKQLGTTADTTGTSVTTTTMSTNPASPTIVAGFVTDVDVPYRTTIPAGLWEFNLWASATSNQPNEVFFRVGVYKYDGTNAPVSISDSDWVGVYNNEVATQYTATALINAGVTLSLTDRIYLQIDTYATNATHTLTCYFGATQPSHTHTTLPAETSVSAPYDFGARFVGTPGTSTILAEWVADRAVLLRSSDWEFWCVTRPTTSTTNLLVKKNGTTIATFQFTTSATQVNNRYEGTLSGSITPTTLAAGDFLRVETDSTVDAAFATPIFSIKGNT